MSMLGLLGALGQRRGHHSYKPMYWMLSKWSNVPTTHPVDGGRNVWRPPHAHSSCGFPRAAASVGLETTRFPIAGAIGAISPPGEHSSVPTERKRRMGYARTRPGQDVFETTGGVLRQAPTRCGSEIRAGRVAAKHTDHTQVLKIGGRTFTLF